jgi:hypothetical protein
MLDEVQLNQIRARAAARARAVRVADGITSDRSLIETDYMTWLRAIFPEQMADTANWQASITTYLHTLGQYGAACGLNLSSPSGFAARAKALLEK